MKKKISYIVGTIVSLITSIFSSATASACGGPMGPLEYIPPKAYRDTKGFKDEKAYMDEKGYYDPKSLTETETYYDEKAYVEEKSYVETKPSPLVTTLQNGKTTVVLTSFPAEKSYAGSKVSIDGVEMMTVTLPKVDTPEKQRILKAIKEMGCLMVKNPDMQDSEEKIKAIFKKYGFKIDDKSMEALEAKYANDTVFMSQVEKAAKSCGGISF